MVGLSIATLFSINAQNVKIQTNGKSGKTQVKVKETPARRQKGLIEYFTFS